MARIQTKASQRQALVGDVFDRCMREDRRTLEEIRAAVRTELQRYKNDPDGHSHLSDWEPTDYDLQIIVGRFASRGEPWEYYPAYDYSGEPGQQRFVSRTRVNVLIQKLNRGTATDAEQRALAEMFADLNRGIRHWKSKHLRAREMAEEIHRLAEDISNVAALGHPETLDDNKSAPAVAPAHPRDTWLDGYAARPLQQAGPMDSDDLEGVFRSEFESRKVRTQ
jgi:hypothetical protein